MLLVRGLYFIVFLAVVWALLEHHSPVIVAEEVVQFQPGGSIFIHVT